jgi:hypothetical protein
MAHSKILHQHQESVTAATLLVPYTPVYLGGTSGLLAIPAASNNHDVFGVTDAATYEAAQKVTVYEDQNVVPLTACASLGAGAVVDIGTTTGRVRPAAGASGAPRYEVGVALAAAADAERVSVRIRPRRNGVWPGV